METFTNQNQFQNSTQNLSEVPDYILIGIKNHISLAFESSKKLLIIDTEGPIKEIEMYERIGGILGDVLREENEDNLNEVSYSELIGAIKIYPIKKVYLLTSMKHMQKHDIYSLSKWIQTSSKIKKYERGLVYPAKYYYIGLDQEKLFTYGVAMYVTSFSEDEIETIARVILNEIMDFHGFKLSEMIKVDNDYKYTILKKNWYIYANEPKYRYTLEEVTSNEEKLEKLNSDYEFYRNHWIWFIEFHSRVLKDLLDP